MFNLTGVEDNEGLLSRIITSIHGPLLAGDILVKALGYNSSESIRQASFRNSVPVTLFRIPKRKLKYALSSEVAMWLMQQRLVNCNKSFSVSIEALQGKSAEFKLFILDYGYLLTEKEVIRLLGLKDRNTLYEMRDAEKIPFGLFRIDQRQTSIFALSIEAFTHVIAT